MQLDLDNTYARLPERFRAQVAPASPAKPTLIAWNDALAAELGVTRPADDAVLARHFGGAELPGGAEPVALAYAGHQFGYFVPQLGDGRAVLLGEIVNAAGERFDIQLKGSGRTPFSRGGDGKSWLGPVLREYVVSEAMHRFDIATTRALAAVATGETVYRDGPLPGAVFTRVAASHLRVGTFEYFAARGDTDALQTLVDYAIGRHYPDARNSERPLVDFLQYVATRQAELVAGWLSVGFVHGVMNTDNTSIAGETLDYGPCAFLDEYESNKVFSSIDRHGRYSYANQPTIALWNLARLADCLLLLDEAKDEFETVLDGFENVFRRRYLERMRTKLGLIESREHDAALVADWFALLERRSLDFTLSFRRLAERVGATDPEYGEFETRWRSRLKEEGRSNEAVAATMNAVNPLFIPRNHRIEEAIERAVGGDFSLFHELNAVLAQPFQEQPAHAALAEPPTPDERVTQTFCGT